jgi:hypothetical protein
MKMTDIRIQRAESVAHYWLKLSDKIAQNGKSPEKLSDCFEESYARYEVDLETGEGSEGPLVLAKIKKHAMFHAKKNLPKFPSLLNYAKEYWTKV